LRFIFEYGYFLIAAFVKLSLLHFRKRYDVIHVHNLPDILVISALIPKLTGAKIILDMHEILPEFFMRKYHKNENHNLIRFLKYLERLSVRFADHVIVATPFLREIVIKRSSTPNHCTTILNLSDPKYFHCKSVNNQRVNGKFRLIYPGTLSELHGVDIAIRAVKLVKSETNIPVELNIYGAGSVHYKNQLISLSQSLNLMDCVKFLEAVPLEELVDSLCQMDAGVVPKRDGMFAGDAMSTKLFDFAAIGLPAIVSRTRGDSLFFDDSMVLFFEPENERQLADAIIRLSDHPELRKSLSEKLQLLYKKVNWGVIKKDLYIIYDQLLLNSKSLSENNRRTPYASHN
jgi:glycosyltransferase involved in cell wall biosynthesis